MVTVIGAKMTVNRFTWRPIPILKYVMHRIRYNRMKGYTTWLNVLIFWYTLWNWYICTCSYSLWGEIILIYISNIFIVYTEIFKQLYSWN
jgi:hypothetical protein